MFKGDSLLELLLSCDAEGSVAVGGAEARGARSSQSVESLQTHLLSLSLSVASVYFGAEAGWSVRLAEQPE